MKRYEIKINGNKIVVQDNQLETRYYGRIENKKVVAYTSLEMQQIAKALRQENIKL